jgi:hypothetical protein
MLRGKLYASCAPSLICFAFNVYQTSLQVNWGLAHSMGGKAMNMSAFGSVFSKPSPHTDLRRSKKSLE